MRTAAEALASGDAARAEAICRAIVSAEGGHAQALLMLGLIEHQRLRHDAAAQCLRRAIAAEPANPDAHALLGQVMRALGRDDEALASWDRALALRPLSPDLRYNRGNLLRAMDRHPEALASYDAALAQAGEDAAMLNNRGVTLNTLGRHEEALDSLARALRVKPDYPEAYSNRGNAFLALHRYDRAAESFERAIALHGREAPASAHSGRGIALFELGRFEEAAAAHRAAFALERDAAHAVALGGALHALGRDEEAVAAYDDAIALGESSAQLWNNRGNALQALARYGEALENYERAIALRPDDAQAHWNEALVLLTLGDYARGWPKYEWRWRNPQLSPPPRPATGEAWTGDSPLAGRSILLYKEQGLGDAIQFVRFAPVVAGQGARVHIACPEALRSLFSRVEGVHAVHSSLQDTPACELHAPLMSLPLAFGTTLQNLPRRVPYLHPDPAQVQQWRERLASVNARTAGIAWAGNPQFPGAAAKRCPPDALFAAVLAAGLQPVSLQVGAWQDDLPQGLIDWSSELRDFSDTAALIEALDCVVTIDTAVAHLAGALGRPVFILLPFAADWRWGVAGERSAWYPTARLLRQARLGDWDAVMRELGRSLAIG